MHTLLGHRDSVIIILAKGIGHSDDRMIDAQKARAALAAAIGFAESQTVWREAFAMSRTSSLPKLTIETKEAIERASEAIKDSDPKLYDFFCKLRILLLSMMLGLCGGIAR